MSNKPKVLWAIHDYGGIIHVYSIRYSRKDSINEFENCYKIPWSEAKKNGWTARKILISKYTENEQ